MKTKFCRVSGCGGDPINKGLCAMHSEEFNRYGRIGVPKRFNDPEEAFRTRTRVEGDCLLWVGRTDYRGLGVLQYKGKKIPAHYYAIQRETGTAPEPYTQFRRTCGNLNCVAVEHLEEV